MRGKTLLPLLLVLLAAAGCRDATGPTADSIQGSYALQSVAGRDLPVPLQAEDPRVTESLVAGSIVLRADNTFTDALIIQRVESGDTSRTEDTVTGTFALDRNVVLFEPTGAGAYSAVVEGDLLTRTIGGVRLTYSK